MTQDQLKQAVAQAAVDFILPKLDDKSIVGVGTGSTANFFIDELAKIKGKIKGAVASSEATAERLRSHGITVLNLNQVDSMPVYIDGADEITPQGAMIKGGGAALTREKIVASLARKFVCIADKSKLVQTLGQFPLPVEIIPMATKSITRKFAALGGMATVRMKNGLPLVTDNGQHILDVTGLKITEPSTFELQVSQWPGVVTIGVFACQKAHVCLLGTDAGVETLVF